MKENTFILTKDEREYILQYLYSRVKNIEEVQDITETDYLYTELVFVRMLIRKLEKEYKDDEIEID